jgi:hypothetical protein
MGLIIGLQDSFLYLDKDNSKHCRVIDGKLEVVKEKQNMQLTISNFWQRDVSVIGRYAYVRSREDHLLRIDLKEREMSVIYYDANR